MSSNLLRNKIIKKSEYAEGNFVLYGVLPFILGCKLYEVVTFVIKSKDSLEYSETISFKYSNEKTNFLPVCGVVLYNKGGNKGH